MQNKKMIGWLIGIPLIMLLLISIILLSEKDSVGISRALAYKSIALSLTSKEECEQMGLENPSSFIAADQDQWYVKYIDYLYHQDLIDPNLDVGNKKAAEEWLTYGEVSYLAEQISKELKASIYVSKKNRDKPYPKDDWWLFYDNLIKYTDQEQNIEQVNLMIYGTPLNINEAKQWRAYTNYGELGFEGLGLDSYIDHELAVLIRDGELIRIQSVISDRVTYKNIWITDIQEEIVAAYIGTVKREFSIKKSFDHPENYINQVVDIGLEQGEIKKVTLKKDRISGKVLSVTENAIEIDGYGSIPLDENFQVYKIYGEFKRQKLTDILVGYEMQEFVVDGKKLCAALTLRDFQAEQIRVMIMNDNFQSIYHNSAIFTSTVPITMFYGEIADQQQVFLPGEQIIIDEHDERLTAGRIILKPSDELTGISVTSIKRSQGTPVYPGNLEIKKTDSGLIMINELYMEEYLKRVVPSEMPASYEKEALKAQAVCARTYAYRHIQGNSYSQFGAHVDDSTGYQVYNNINTDGKTNAAVDETYGKLLMYQDQIAETFYFSTSCGHTTDGTIWGSSAESYPYLKGSRVVDGGGAKDLKSNVEFTEFIKNNSIPSYESEFPLYRWSTTITSKQLEQKVSDLGRITKITMRDRDTGGIGKILEIEGTEATKVVNGQGQIRSILGNAELKIKRNDGEIMTGYDTLPSAFIAIERSEPDENQVTTFSIYGGGYGHGVGMSQNGAQGMAKTGKNYEEILTFFYPDTEVKSEN